MALLIDILRVSRRRICQRLVRSLCLISSQSARLQVTMTGLGPRKGSNHHYRVYREICQTIISLPLHYIPRKRDRVGCIVLNASVQFPAQVRLRLQLVLMGRDANRSRCNGILNRLRRGKTSKLWQLEQMLRRTQSSNVSLQLAARKKRERELHLHFRSLSMKNGGRSILATRLVNATLLVLPLRLIKEESRLLLHFTILHPP